MAAQPSVPSDAEQRQRAVPDTPGDSSANLAAEIQEVLASLKAKNARLEKENADLRGAGSWSARYFWVPLKRWAGFIAIFGWLFAAAFIAFYGFTAVAFVYHTVTAVDDSLVPFDPVTLTKRTGNCYENPKRVCVELPPEQALHNSIGLKGGERHARVAFWNSTKDNSIKEAFRKLAMTHASEKSYDVLTTRGPANLLDIRNNIQRRVVKGEYDFACATFFGWPIDYCVMIVQRNTTAYLREWLDIVGDIILTRVEYGTIVVEASLPSGLCEHAGSGQSPRHVARYFESVCFQYRTLTGQLRQECVKDMDAVTVQQLYEMQRGIVSCCDDADRLGRIVARQRQDSVLRI